jgi:hypothetical protein
MRKRGRKALGDERILGSDDFVREVLKEAADGKEVPLSEHERVQLFDEAAEQACEAAGVTVTFLRSGSRSGQLPSLRKQLAKKGAFEIGLPLAEIARRLGVTPSAVSYMLKRQ